MRKRVAEILMTIAKILPFVVMLALVALYLPNKDAVSVDSILRYTPDNLWLAALAVLAAYAVKSLSVFFPLLVLYAAAGLLFLPFWSICPACWCVSPSPTASAALRARIWWTACRKNIKKSPASTRLSGAASFSSPFFCASLSFCPGMW